MMFSMFMSCFVDVYVDYDDVYVDDGGISNDSYIVLPGSRSLCCHR